MKRRSILLIFASSGACLLASSCGNPTPEENNTTPEVMLNNSENMECVDADQDGYFVRVSNNSSADCGALDCNDRDSRAAPGNLEICGNGVDDDCAGDGDEECEVIGMCEDGMQNGAEQGIDCGGSCDTPCSTASVESFDLAGRGDNATLYAGVPFDMDLSLALDTQKCVECTTQARLLIKGGEAPISECIEEFVSGSSDTGTRDITITLNAPEKPGTYQLEMLYTNDASCEDSSEQSDANTIPLGSLEVIEPAGVPTQIKHAQLGTCVDVPVSSLDDGEDLILYPCSSLPNQLWTLEPDDNGRYLVRAQHSGKCFDVPPMVLDDGEPIAQFNCRGRANQQISLHAKKGGYEMKIGDSGKCIQPGMTDGDVPLVQGPCSGEEIFLLEPQPDTPAVRTFVNFEHPSTLSYELSSDTIQEQWGFGNVLTFGGNYAPILQNKRNLTLERIEFYVNAPTDTCPYTIGVYQVRGTDEVFNELRTYSARATRRGEQWITAAADARLVDGTTYYFSIRPDSVCFSTTEGNSYVLGWNNELTGTETRFSVGNYERTGMFYDTSQNLPDFPNGPTNGQVSNVWSDMFTYKPVVMRLQIKAMQ